MVEGEGAVAAQLSRPQVVGIGDSEDLLGDLRRAPAIPGLVPVGGQPVDRGGQLVHGQELAGELFGTRPRPARCPPRPSRAPRTWRCPGRSAGGARPVGPGRRAFRRPPVPGGSGASPPRMPHLPPPGCRHARTRRRLRGRGPLPGGARAATAARQPVPRAAQRGCPQPGRGRPGAGAAASTSTPASWRSAFRILADPRGAGPGPPTPPKLVELGLEIDALVHELPEDRVVEARPIADARWSSSWSSGSSRSSQAVRIPCSVDGTTYQGASTIVAASCSA